MNQFGCPCCGYTTLLPETGTIAEATCPHACTLHDWKDTIDREQRRDLPNPRSDRVELAVKDTDPPTYEVERQLRLIVTDGKPYKRYRAALKGYWRTDGGMAA